MSIRNVSSQIGEADDRFVDSIEVENESSGNDRRGLQLDVATRWSSVCKLFESAAASYEVLNDVLGICKAYGLILEDFEIHEIRVVARIYRVSCLPQ